MLRCIKLKFETDSSVKLLEIMHQAGISWLSRLSVNQPNLAPMSSKMNYENEAVTSPHSLEVGN